MVNFFSSISFIKLLASISCVLMRSTANAKLLNASEDMNVVVGESVNFTCSSNILAEIHWRRNDEFMYAGGKFYGSYKEKFQLNVTQTTEAYVHTLVLLSAKPEDAGIYECRESQGVGELSSAYLTVLDSNLICHYNMNADGYVGPNTCYLQQEIMRFHCSVSFHATHPPRLQWTSTKSDAVFNSSSCNYQPNKANCSLILGADPFFDGTIFTCHATAPNGVLYRPSCSTGVVKIQYLYLEQDLEPVEKRVNDEMRCLVRSSQVVRYNWLLIQNDQKVVLSTNQSDVIRNTGVHWCRVSYNIRNATCLAIAYVVHAINDEEITIDRKLLLLLILLLAVTVSVFIIGFLAYAFCRREWKRAKLKKRLACDNEEGEATADLLENDKEWAEHEKPGFLRPLNAHLLTCGKEALVYRRRPKLIKTIQYSSRKQAPLCGIAILEGKLYTVRENFKKIEVYSLTDFSQHKSCPLEDLENPWDIVSDQNAIILYIENHKTDDSPSEIIRVKPDGMIEARKSIEYDGKTATNGRMSIANDGRIIIPLMNKNTLLVYKWNGTEIQLTNDIKSLGSDVKITNLRQAILLKSGHLVMSYGDGGETEKQGIFITDAQGESIKSFGCKDGNSEILMNIPSHMASPEDLSIVVADRRNSRVLLFHVSETNTSSPRLTFQRELLSRKEGLHLPWRVCVDIKRGWLIVADNKENKNNNSTKSTINLGEDVAVNGRMLIYSAF